MRIGRWVRRPAAENGTSPGPQLVVEVDRESVDLVVEDNPHPRGQEHRQDSKEKDGEGNHPRAGAPVKPRRLDQTGRHRTMIDRNHRDCTVRPAGSSSPFVRPNPAVRCWHTGLLAPLGNARAGSLTYYARKKIKQVNS